MTRYIATFHTHLAALTTSRALEARGVSARMAPVPRKLSSSCGTCVRYEAETPCLDSMDEDMERVVFVSSEDEYELIFENI
jgi:hypothetical protein